MRERDRHQRRRLVVGPPYQPVEGPLAHHRRPHAERPHLGRAHRPQQHVRRNSQITRLRHPRHAQCLRGVPRMRRQLMIDTAKKLQQLPRLPVYLPRRLHRPPQNSASSAETPTHPRSQQLVPLRRDLATTFESATRIRPFLTGAFFATAPRSIRHRHGGVSSASAGRLTPSNSNAVADTTSGPSSGPYPASSIPAMIIPAILP